MGERLTNLLLELMGQLDYFAIFILMAAESSILPVPSELVMIPAGYLVSTQKLTWSGSMLASSLGSIVGSLGSYYLALWLGRPFIARFGRYLLITEHHLVQTENFFAKHGEISILTGRFLPGVRHLISMPAGVGRMRLSPFILYTLVGATLWNLVLLVLGFVIGENQEWVKQHTLWVVGGAVLFALLLLAGYLFWQKRRQAG
ncbi:MAG: DedA family protein [Magnetococcales bacterium]|nr:DedA family protein [Magnetococcales bacterium]NGZ05104.1 DedA family protein [Magnetococcales bacterium]